MTEVTSFWARRRAAVKAEEEAEVRAAEEATLLEAQEGKSDAEILEEFGLPDPETMKEGDDFSGFMASGVPEHLRRVALRTLWRSNPVLANLDGLNEYDDDYRAAMLLSEPVKTTYQVGKGMKAHLDELARKAKALEEGVSDEVSQVDDGCEIEGEEADSGAAPVEHVTLESVSSDTATDVAIAPTAANVSANDEMPIPRRMRFRFEETTL